MAQRVIFALYDHSGDLLEGQVPSVVLYRKTDGSAATPVPAVTEVGDGHYQFEVDYDLHGPVAYMVDCGSESAVKYLVGSAGELVAFAMYDADGEPDDSLVPSFLSFSDGDVDLTPPEIVDLTGGLYGFWPSVEAGKIVYYTVGNSSNKYSGSIGTTSLSNLDPAAESTIPNTQVISFDVLDTEAHLGRVLIAVQYPAFRGAAELAWDGEEVCGPFQVSSEPVSNGRRYTVLRTGGWPSAPVVRVFLTNFGGREL